MAVMLSKALQRNAKHEARLSNISDPDSDFTMCLTGSEILRIAQNDILAVLVEKQTLL